jgi:hypothetical protein
MNESLRLAIASDLAPVAPLASPARRALPLVPLAALLLLAAPLTFEFRDLTALGWRWSWGASLLQIVIGFAVVTLALRQAVPGRGWPTSAIALTVAAIVLLFAVITFGTWSASPVTLRRQWWVVGAICAVFSTATALPVVVATALLANRAFPLHPRLTGGLAGLGAGLMADAGWRLFCHYSEPAHVLAAHFGGVVIAAAIGASLVRITAPDIHRRRSSRTQSYR